MGIAVGCWCCHSKLPRSFASGGTQLAFYYYEARCTGMDTAAVRGCMLWCAVLCARLCPCWGLQMVSLPLHFSCCSLLTHMATSQLRFLLSARLGTDGMLCRVGPTELSWEGCFQLHSKLSASQCGLYVLCAVFCICLSWVKQHVHGTMGRAKRCTDRVSFSS